MIVKEYPIQPILFQEINIPDTANVLKVVIKSEGEAVLLVEDLQDDCIQDRAVGIYMVSSYDDRSNEIPENYMYMETLRMASELGVLLFHVYIEAIDITDLFGEPDEDAVDPLGEF